MEELGGGAETAAPGLDWAATVLVYRCTALYWPAGEPGGGGGSHSSGENRLPLPGRGGQARQTGDSVHREMVQTRKRHTGAGTALPSAGAGACGRPGLQRGLLLYQNQQ